MYFLNASHRDSLTDRGVYIYRCGLEVFPNDYGRMYQIIEETLPGDQERFAAIRKQVYDYSFVHRPWDVVRDEIFAATS